MGVGADAKVVRQRDHGLVSKARSISNNVEGGTVTALGLKDKHCTSSEGTHTKEEGRYDQRGQPRS